jgi:hypothetical protein
MAGGVDRRRFCVAPVGAAQAIRTGTVFGGMHLPDLGVGCSVIDAADKPDACARVQLLFSGADEWGSVTADRNDRRDSRFRG